MTPRGKSTRKKHGRVYLVGFGPGAPDLMTLRAEKVLREADIVFYDDLIDAKFIQRYPAKKVYVGKRGKKKGVPQSEVNRLLFAAAQQYRRVVRLKGGDPFIFGRGGEEFSYLRSKSVEVEIIPGVTAALGAAACAGIPLTQRGISSSVAFCVGHPEDKVRIPDTGTVVYYMAGENIKIIAEKLIEKGWDPGTPVAFIIRATLPKQQTIFSTLRKEALKARRRPSPFLMIVGETVTSSRRGDQTSSLKVCCAKRECD